MTKTIRIYTHGTVVEADASVLYNAFPEDTTEETPESSDVGTGSDNDNTTHSDDWGNDEEDE